MNKVFLMTVTILSLLTLSSCSNKKSSESTNETSTPMKDTGNLYMGIDTPVTTAPLPTKNSSQEGVLSNTGSENWDKMLDDYNDYVDKYVAFYKKAMNGDQNAMAEYPALLEKSTDLQASIAKAQEDKKLSMKQMNRMTKIQAQMLAAISNK